MLTPVKQLRAGRTRVCTRAVITPPGGKADKKQPKQPIFQRKKAASALPFLSQNEELQEEGSGLDKLGLYGRQPCALEQASSVTSAYRALMSSEDEYVDGESAPGMWEKLSRKMGDRYIM